MRWANSLPARWLIEWAAGNPLTVYGPEGGKVDEASSIALVGPLLQSRAFWCVYIAQIILDRLGWERDRLIDASVTSDEVERGRPHPDMIHFLMRRLGIADARQVAKVGDTPADLEEGHRAGCGLNIGVTQGAHSREQLAAHPHTHLIGTVADLPELLAVSERARSASKGGPC
jgi:hypothetical protein